MASVNSLLAVLKIEKGAEFEDALKRVEEAKEICISTAKPDDHCHAKSQAALKHTLAIYSKIMDDYRKRLPNRPSPTPRS